MKLIIFVVLIINPLIAVRSQQHITKEQLCTGSNQQICNLVDSMDGKIDAECIECVNKVSDNPNESEYVRKTRRTLRSIQCRLDGHCQKPILGQNECLWGPEHVCKTLKTLTQCNMFLTCSEKWLNLRLDNAIHDTECIECQRTLSNIHLNYNNPVSFMKPKMLTYMTQLIAMRNLTNGGISPAVLCNKLGMCQGHLVQTAPNDVECILAHSIWIRIRGIIKGYADDYNGILDQLLRESNKDSRSEQAIFHYLPTFLSKYKENLLNTNRELYYGDEPAVYVKACSPRLDTPFTCDVCLTLTMLTKNALSNNATAEFVRKSLKKICGLVPNEKECIDYIDDHIDWWMENIENNFDPVKICGDMRLCSKQEMSVAEQSILEHSKSGIICDKCKDFMSNFKKRLTCKIKKIFNFILPSLCRLFGPFEDKCLIKTFDIKEWILENVDYFLNPDIRCHAFCSNSSITEFSPVLLIDQISNDFCNSSKPCVDIIQPILSTIALTNDEIDTTVQGKNDCLICRSLYMEDIKTALWDCNDTDCLNKLCPEDSGDDGQCLHFVKKYYQKIIDSVVNQTSDDNLCSQINACTKADDNCLVCSLLTNKLGKMLPSSLNEENVHEAISHVCSLLNYSTVSRELCDSFVFNFEQTMTILLINKQISTRRLCSSMGVCLSKHQPVKVQMNTCEICRFAVEAIEKGLEQNQTIEFITKWLESACGRLPHSFQDKCKRLVEEDLPYIIKMLSMAISPEVVCSELGFCSFVKNSDNMCTLCQVWTIVAKGYIENQHVVEKATSMMNRTCEMTFEDLDWRTDCLEAVHSVEKILQHTIHNVDVVKMCSMFHFCSTQKANFY